MRHDTEIGTFCVVLSTQMFSSGGAQKCITPLMEVEPLSARERSYCLNIL